MANDFFANRERARTAGTRKGKQGFASMDPEKQRKIASMGGKAQGAWNNKGNFINDPEKARRAGQVGGRKGKRGAGPSRLDDQLKDAA